jgi:CzcA family heavy metal efflux pump
VLVTIGGILAYNVLPTDVYPELSFPRIAVIAEAGDMSPERAVVSITRPLEQAVGQVYNVRWIRSKTIRGSAEINVDFQEGSDMQYALQQLQARIGEIRNDLPANTNLTIERVTPAIFPVIIYNISSDTLTQSDLSYIATFVIKPAITRVPGVARVIAQGGATQQVSVQVDPAKLSALRVSLSQISDALQKSNQVQVLGKFNREHQLNLVVGREEFKNIDELNNVVIGETTREGSPTPVPAGEPGSNTTETGTTPMGAPIFLRDVATVSWGIADPTQIISANGKPGIAMNIFRQPNSNVVAVSKGVSKAFERLKKHLPSGLNISPSYDESHLVVDAITNVRDAIFTGIFMIVLVLFLFLRQWRSTLIAACTIPISALAAFGILKLLGQSLNLMSLGGLAVAIGLVIDDAVVVIENIDHQMAKGLEASAAVAQALKELTTPVVSSTATTLVVFIPLGLLSGVAGQFFTSFTMTLTAAVLVSLVLSLTLTPMLSARWLKAKKTPPPEARETEAYSRYERVLRAAFAKPKLIGITAVAIMLLAILVGTHLGSDFMPAVDEGSYMLDYLSPPGSSLAETDSIARVLEQILGKTPEVVAYTRRTAAESGIFATESNKGDIQVVLKPSNKRHRTIWQIMDDQREEAEKLLPNADIDFHQILQDELNDLSGVESTITIKAFGQELPVLRQLGQRINDAVEKTPGLVDLIVTGQAGAAQTDIQVDSSEAARIGLTKADVLAQVHDALLGGISTQIRQADRLVDVRLRLNDRLRADPAKLSQIPIIGSGASAGKILPLGAIANISLVPGEGAITRENQQRYVSVNGNVENRDLGSVVADIQKKISTIAPPPGYNIDLGGTFLSQQTAFSQLLLIMTLGIVLVYFVLVVQFRSWAQPLTIFTAIPLSLFGVVLALWLTKMTFNVSSFMGVILLVGLVVKNGIILIDFANRLIAEGLDLDEALIQAGRIRLRPILMTTLCTLLGLLPLALGFGSGSELQKPLAIAVIGGLSLSTIFTLVFMPVVLRLLERRNKRAVARSKPQPALR